MVKRYGLTFVLIILFIGVLFAVFYAMQEEDQDYSYPTYEYEISPRFREFYEQLGGDNTLGVGISQKFSAFDKEYQYVAAGLMRFDPALPDGMQFSLSAIGNELGIEQFTNSSVEHGGNNDLLNGHSVYPKFGDMYFNVLEGSKFGGMPLSDPVPDPESKRTIQYFENIGLYVNEDDPDGTVHLLPYGVWMCRSKCLEEGDVDQAAIFPPSMTRELLFDRAAEKYIGFHGEKITDLDFADDGNFERIYENIVLFASPGNLENIEIRPLPKYLGYKAEEPKLPTTVENHRFIFTTDDYGFHINDNIYNFIEQNGGTVVLGEPIQQPVSVAENVWEQCFEKICLRYSGNGSNIQVLPLGREYQTRFVEDSPQFFVYTPLVVVRSNTGSSSAVVRTSSAYPEPQIAEEPVEEIEFQESVDPLAEPEPTVTVTENGVRISAVAAHELIPSTEGQRIDINISMNGEPAPGVNTEVTILRPDGTVQTLYPSVTDLNGDSFLNIKPISAPNGARIEYSVCLLGRGDNPSDCIQGDYLIWGNSP